jgi:hypothetical protein
MSLDYELPREVDAFRALLGELYDDLPQRVERLRLLSALDHDFGGSGVMIPGGEATFRAYTEARSCFVAGHFAAVILLSQALVETLLGAQIDLEQGSYEIHGKDFGDTLTRRPSLDEIVRKAKQIGLLDDDDERALKRMREMRNPLTHFRNIDDPTNMTRRMLNQRTHPTVLFEDDARFCITTVIRILSKPTFAIGRSA